MTPIGNVKQLFDAALRNEQAGRVAEAERLYRQVLAQRPNHAEALHRLGVFAYRAGQYPRAMELLQRSLALKPQNAGAESTLGTAFAMMNRWDEAIAAYRRATRAMPGYAEAYSNLGNALRAKGQLDEAIAAYRRSVSLKPDMPEAQNNLGNALKEAGLFDEAIVACRAALTLRPAFAQAHSNLGNALQSKGQLDDAIACYRQAVTLQPDFADAQSNLSQALIKRGEVDEATAAARRAIALLPHFAAAHTNLGNALRARGLLDESVAALQMAVSLNPEMAEAFSSLGSALNENRDLEAAIDAYRRALDLKPTLSDAWTNLGTTLQSLGRFDEAIAAHRRALAINPNYAEAHSFMAMLLLMQGQWAEGWKEYEWRWRCEQFGATFRRFDQPRWDGGDVAGRTVLLHVEQGMGDTIQFIRYVPLIAERGANVIVECDPSMLRLLQRMPGIDRCIPCGQSLPEFDAYCSMMSLPLIFGTTQENAPRTVPYLQPDPADVSWWAKETAERSGRTNVGLVWAGQPKHPNDHNRSLPLAALAPLAQVAGIRFFSLQKGDAATQAANPPPGMDLTDRTEGLNDFADTAALIASLDLVITVDTSIAHLAGALGKPVWVLLPFVPDWRWILDREDSPWYPTMRLFRQPARGNWSSVIARVAAELSALR